MSPWSLSPAALTFPCRPTSERISMLLKLGGGGALAAAADARNTVTIHPRRHARIHAPFIRLRCTMLVSCPDRVVSNCEGAYWFGVMVSTPKSYRVRASGRNDADLIQVSFMLCALLAQRRL